ncbi:MAG: winged helix-turn-helix domain-containing protein [Erysipelotrichia bacterium]|jgi:DNA-binding SARP family transcriptional activator|nr:winged helix-turn-helix domain-containing protein [Erysipelotrichia bacterium]
MGNKIKIGISTFGELTVISGCEVFRIDGYLTKNVRYLLEILIYYRMTPLSKNQIIDLLWSGSHNPESALKFTVHRLRQALKDIPIFEETPLVITTKHGYDLNPEFDYDIDFEEVDNLWKMIQNPNRDEKDKKKLLLSLITKINKPFLASSSALLWTIPIREYYSNIFNQSLMMLLEMSEKARKYQDLIQYAHRGITFNRLNEDFHYYYILGLIYDRQIRQAIEAYEKTRELFLTELKSDLSEKTKDLFKLLLSKDEINFVKMGDLIMNLNENSPHDGAFYCEYEVFKRMYQNQMRTQSRNQELACLVILELRNTQQTEFDMSKAMEKLKKAIDHGLRRSDVYSRINSLQFVLLLPCKSKDNGYTIVERIQRIFYKNLSRDQVKLYSYMNVVENMESQLQ